MPGRRLNLLLEAPLSVAFTEEGNPTGRSIETRSDGTRYWYVGLGCGVLVPAMYLLRAIASAQNRREVLLYEGFVSFKQRGARSSHTDDVLRLREVVWRPSEHPGALISPERLALVATDVVSSAFAVLGLDTGVPPVVVVTVRPAALAGSHSQHPERTRRP